MIRNRPRQIVVTGGGSGLFANAETANGFRSGDFPVMGVFSQLFRFGPLIRL